MAHPVVLARTATNITTASTSWAINTGTPVNGELAIVFVRFAAAPGAVTFTGYTPLVSAETSDATDDTTSIYYRTCDGNEGSTDTLAPTNSVKGCAIYYRIRGHTPVGVQAPQNSTVAIGTTTLNTANPATLSPTGGSKDYLWLALMAEDGETDATVVPANYTNLITANSGTAGAVATNCSIAGGERAFTSASDDPGVFTHAAAATGWTAYTVAIHPEADRFTGLREPILMAGMGVSVSGSVW